MQSTSSASVPTVAQSPKPGLAPPAPNASASIRHWTASTEPVAPPQKALIYSSPEWWMVGVTLLLALITLILAIYTGKLYRATVRLGKDARDTGTRQADEMEQSIAQATRSATAMEDVAKATSNNANIFTAFLHKQMRAYIAVNTGKAVYQDANLKFESSPVLTNTGLTPARNISYVITADILPTSLPEDFVFADHGCKRDNDATLSPRQEFVISSVVDKRFSDEEVKTIMEGREKRLYVWGTIKYEDIFGSRWHTNFCHSFVFPRNKEGEVAVFSNYNPTHNDST